MSYIKSRKHSRAGLQHYFGAGATASLMLLGAHPALAADDAVVAAAAVTAAADAAADDQPGTVEGVDVAGGKSYKAPTQNVKATAKLVDTPQTINVITTQIVREQAATTLAEALRNSAGVGTFSLGENGNTTTGDAVFLRGTDVSTSIFVDGVRDMGSVSRDVFNIEQIEVLKGGAGSDTGRGSATGSINVYSKRAVARDIRSGTLAFGGADYKRATADIGVPLGDTSAIRVNVVYQDAGVAGRDRVKNKRWGIAPSLGFGLGTNTEVIFNYLHIDQDNTPDGGVFTIGLPGYTSPDATRPFLTNAPRVKSTNFYGTKDDHDDVKMDMATAIVEHRVNEQLTFSNLSRYGRTKQDYQLGAFMAATAGFLTPSVTDRNTWTMGRNINQKNVRNEIWANQSNLRGNFDVGGMANNFVVGVEFIREEQLTGVITATGAYPAVSIYNPVGTGGNFVRAINPNAYSKGVTETVAAYIGDTLTVTDQILVNAGLRVDSYTLRKIIANSQRLPQHPCRRRCTW